MAFGCLCAASALLGVIKHVSVDELGDVGKISEKSFLFYKEGYLAGIGLSADRDIASVRHHPSCGARNSLVGP